MRVALQALRHADSLAALRETDWVRPASPSSAGGAECHHQRAAMVARAQDRLPDAGKAGDIVLLDADALNLFPDDPSRHRPPPGIANVGPCWCGPRGEAGGKSCSIRIVAAEGAIAEASRGSSPQWSMH